MWKCALELSSDRRVTAGTTSELCAAIDRGADLRIYTEFLFEEHIEPKWVGDPQYNGLIREVIDFRQTMLVNGRHTAAVTTMRQPLHPPFGFNGTQPKMSFFLYNMDGQQACANLVLDDSDCSTAAGAIESFPPPDDMPKMSAMQVFDGDTYGPGRNFIYNMEVYRYFVRDDWELIYAHDADGAPTAGVVGAIEQAQLAGREIKVGIRDLNSDWNTGVSHEIFSQVGSGFYHCGPRIYACSTHPIVRVKPGIPVVYDSQGWDLCWLFLRSDGRSVIRRLDPLTRRFTDRETRLACRWFAR
ncbi:MAG: hypothetical protein WEB58_08200 [Planctomycetaceae bacterium]